MNNKILNLTQHNATAEQIKAGVVSPKLVINQNVIKELLTFNSLPTAEDITVKAQALADVACSEQAEAVMIGGAPYLMGPLESALKTLHIVALYAYSERVSVEKIVDGKTIKTAEFKHLGFIKA